MNHLKQITPLAQVASFLLPLEALALTQTPPFRPLFWCLISAITLGVLGTWWTIGRARNDNPFSPQIREIKDVTGKALNHLLLLGLPVFLVADHGARFWVMWFVYVAFYVFIMARSGLLLLNLLFVFLGWRIWEVRLEDGTVLGFVLAKKRPDTAGGEGEVLLTGDGCLFFVYPRLGA